MAGLDGVGFAEPWPFGVKKDVVGVGNLLGRGHKNVDVVVLSIRRPAALLSPMT